MGRSRVLPCAALALALPLAGAATGVAAPAARAGPPPLRRPPAAGPGEQVLLTRAEALREIFGDPGRVVEDRWRLAPDEVAALEARAGDRVPDPTPATLRVYAPDGSLLGYAMVLDERGKYRPITFMVGVGPDLAVRGVEVLVYREDRGGEVRYPRFLDQYRGKTTSDPIRTHRDIVNVTGATISVHALNDGVRRALAIFGLVYGGKGRQPVSSAPLDLASDAGVHG